MIIESSSGLTDNDIDDMVKDAETHAHLDAERRKGIEIRNNADSLVYQTDKTVAEHGSKVSDEEREEITTALTELKTLLEGDDIPAIEIATKTLEETTHKLAEAMYAHAAQEEAEAVSTATAGATAGTNDDSTVVDNKEKQ